MKFKLYLILGLLFLFVQSASAQNSLIISSMEVSNSSNFAMNVSLNNADQILALQFDIAISEEAFVLQTEHLLTDRGVNHSLGVSSPSPGIVRVIIYSANNSSIVGTSGDLLSLHFRSLTLPGDYNLSISDVIASSATGTSLDVEVETSTIKVLGPQLEIETSEINFGRIPLGNNPTRILTVRNVGNQALELTSSNNIDPFGIQENFPITIAANSSENLTITLNTAAKGIKEMDLIFQNSDPDPLRKIKKVELKADVFAVNEIKIGSGSGEIDTEVEIPVVIDNMEAFTGFQFDIILPEGIEFVSGSLIESNRFDGHSLVASIIGDNTVRILAYSATNTNFNGNSGEVFSFKLIPKVSSGTYPLVIEEAIISYPGEGNILSQAYNGSISINAPNLYFNPTTISYGDVPITETRTSVIRLYNYGDALLSIDALVFEAEELDFDITLPLEIPQGEYRDLTMIFTPSSSGDFEETVSIRHNGPSGQDLLTIEANVFSPNFLKIESQDAYLNEENTFQVFLKNNDAVRAVQFDLELPNGFELDLTNVATTLITSEYLLSASELSLNNYRIIMYSQTNTALNKGDQAIIEIPVFINSGLILGEYQFIFRNVIISDENNKDISSIALENGTITLINRILEFNKTMSSGWNWFSVYLLEADMGLDNILSSLNPQDGDYIKDRKGTGNSAQFYNIPGTFTGWTGTLSELDPKETYKIKLANEGDVIYQGSPIDYETEQIPVLAGWNWVGYPIPFEIPVSEYLTTLDLVDGDYLKDQINSTTYYDAINDWFGQLEIMIPGDGYVLNVSNAGSIYEPITEFKAAIISANADVVIDIPKYSVRVSDFEFSGSATIEVFVYGNNVGSETNILYAFNQDNVCVGIINGLQYPMNNKYLYNLMMYSNIKEEDELYFKFFDRDINKWYSFEETLAFEEDMIIATAYHPFELRNAIADEFIEESNDIIVFPNPFMERLNYSFVLDANKNVKISIVNAIGVVVEVLEDRTFSAGQHLLEWNNVSLAQGYYYLRIEMDGFEKTIQILKMN